MTRRCLRLLFSAVLLCGLPLHASVPPNTGKNTIPDVTGARRDASYTIEYDDTGLFAQLNQTIGSTAFAIASYSDYFCCIANGWANSANSLPGGAGWISPHFDQRNANRPGNLYAGDTRYQIKFLAFEGADIGAYIMADDNLVVRLVNSIYPAGRLVTQASGQYQSPDFFNLCSRDDCTAKIAPGLNTVTFIVHNNGGPTGLNVAWVGDLNDVPNYGVSTSSGPYSLQSGDPVDGAGGQYYDTVDDLKLGGSLGLKFSRFYSSLLSGTLLASGLGLNWMSNFDVALAVSATSAKAVLFGGRVVQFTASGGAWQLQSPSDIVYQLVTAGTSYKLLDPTTRRIYTFNAHGSLIRIEDRNGNALTVTPGAYGPTAVSDGLGRTLTLTYTKGTLSKVQDQGGRAVTFAYNGNLLQSATDPFNGVTQYSYNTDPKGFRNGLLTVKKLPRGNTQVSQKYDEFGRVVSQTDGAGNVTTMAYDNSGGTTITDPLGAVTRFTNDQNGNLKVLTDPAGGAANVTYDAAGRRTGVTDKSGNVTTFTWHSPSGYLASIVAPGAHTTAYEYTAQTQGPFTFYNPTKTTYPDGTSRVSTYDANGNLLTLTLGDGSVTRFSYDSAGRLLTLTKPNNGVTTLVWNADGTMASSTDSAGNKTVYGYDSLKRPNKVTDPNGAVTSYVYDAAGQGRMFAGTGPSGESNTLTYDANGQQKTRVNAVGGTSTLAYTNTGEIATYTDPLTNKTSYTYDGADRMSSIADATGVLVTYSYDTQNRVKSISNASGIAESYTYNADGYIASQADGSGNKTSFTYDGLGRFTGFTNPAGGRYTTTYDKLGKALSNTNPLGEVHTLTRDANGNVTQVGVPGGLTTAIARNSLGLPASFTSANGNKWTFTYDQAGRRTQVADPLGNVTGFTYTGEQLTQTTLPLGALTLTNDASGRVTKRQYSDGTVINEAYDANSLTVSADKVSIQRDAHGQPTGINGIGITLDGAGRTSTLTYASGKVITYTYNNTGRVATVADWVGGKTSIAYNPAGRISTVTYPNGVVTTYSYDVNGLLVKVVFGTLGSITLTRDADGKITAADRSLPLTPVTAPLSSQQFTYDAAGQLASATSDKMGRVTAQGSRTYTWNLASQLTSFQDGSNSSTMTYDGLGEMNTLTAGGATRTFVFNYLFPLPALSIVRQGGSDLRYYVYLPDGLLLYGIEAGNTRRYFHFDEMGNTALLSGDNGAATDSYAITPYGDIADHSGTTDNPFTWQGQYGVIREAAALYYMRNRHYDASAARFLSRDPVILTDPRSSEPYAYGNGNPLRFVDPFGTCFLWFIGNDCNPPKRPPQPIIFDSPPPAPPPVAVAPPVPVYYPTPVPVRQTPVTLFKLSLPNGSIRKTSDGLYHYVRFRDGGRLLGQDGASLVGQDGGTLTVTLPDGTVLLIGQDGASLLSENGAGIIGDYGSGLVSDNGGRLVSDNGGRLVSDNGGRLVDNVNRLVTDLGGQFR